MFDVSWLKKNIFIDFTIVFNSHVLLPVLITSMAPGFWRTEQNFVASILSVTFYVELC